VEHAHYVNQMGASLHSTPESAFEETKRGRCGTDVVEVLTSGQWLSPYKVTKVNTVGVILPTYALGPLKTLHSLDFNQLIIVFGIPHQLTCGIPAEFYSADQNLDRSSYDIFLFFFKFSVSNPNI
jgi:hypothetical protein